MTVRILIDITHPAHVHFFRNAIREAEALGHTVATSAIDKDIAISLLRQYEIRYRRIEAPPGTRFSAASRMLGRDAALWKFARTFQPDIITAVGGACAAQVAFALRVPSVVWDDTEHHRLGHLASRPFATEVHSPDCYYKPHSPKQVLYPGCHDLAYLHPDRFTPRPSVVRDLGIDIEAGYCIVRFIGWNARHDRGQSGFGSQGKVDFVNTIARYTRPYITSEGPLPAELEQYRLRIPEHLIHDVMAFATLYAGESPTMATEAATLGVPGVYVSTLGAGVLDMFESYGLIKQTADPEEAMTMASSLIADSGARARARRGRDAFLSEKIDVTQYIIETLERVGRQ